MSTFRNRPRVAAMLTLLLSVLVSPVLLSTVFSTAARATTGSAAATTTLAFSPNPAAAGQTVHITVTVTPVSPGGPAPTGVVNFGSTADGATTATLNGASPDVAVVDLPTDATGGPMSASVTAYYPGDANYAPSASAPQTLTITANPVTISPTSLSPAAVGVPYRTTLAAIGGASPYRWSIIDRALPPGISLDPATGTISGTPTTPGTDGFTVEARDSGSDPLRADENLQIVISGASPGPVAITTASLPDGAVGAAYDATLAADGGTVAYNWRLSAGTLPAGLSFSGNTGRITGTPTAAGTSTVTAQVYDSSAPFQTATRDLTITISPSAAPIITTGSLPEAGTGISYAASLSAVGGSAPYNWSLAAGSTLPAGLSLHPDGTVTGTPSVPGTVTLTAQVADSASPARTATKQLSLPVKRGVTTTVSASPNPAVAGQTVQVTVTVAPLAPGGPPPTGMVNFGSTDPGATTATLNGQNPDRAFVTVPSDPTSGAMSGPIVAHYPGDANYAAAVSAPATLTFTATPVTITPTSLPAATVGLPFAARLSAAGGLAPYSWAVLGRALPPGITFDPAIGVISGTPTTPGTVDVIVEARDSGANPLRAEQDLRFVIGGNSPGPLAITTSSLPSAVVGQPYSATIAANGGTLGYSWRITSGALPDGLTFDAGTGTITGRPTTAGTSMITAAVFDSSTPFQTANQDLTITASPPAPLAVGGTSTLPAATVGAAYRTALTATGGTAPYRWALASGSTLGSGLTLTSDGTISGMPTSAKTSSFTVRVTDASNPASSATRTLTLVVKPSPLRSDLAVSLVHIGTFVHGRLGSYRVTVTNTGNAATVGTLTLSVKLPTGLTYTAISGTGWGCRRTGSAVTCTTTHSLPPGGNSQLLVRVGIPAPIGATVTTTAVIAPTDGTPTDNTATVRTRIQRS